MDRHGKTAKRAVVELTTARCGITTPFGFPVEPDVKIAYAASAGSRAAGVGGADAGRAVAGTSPRSSANPAGSAPVTRPAAA